MLRCLPVDQGSGAGTPRCSSVIPVQKLKARADKAQVCSAAAVDWQRRQQAGAGNPWAQQMSSQHPCPSPKTAPDKKRKTASPLCGTRPGHPAMLRSCRVQQEPEHGGRKPPHAARFFTATTHGSTQAAAAVTGVCKTQPADVSVLRRCSVRQKRVPEQGCRKHPMQHNSSQHTTHHWLQLAPT